MNKACLQFATDHIQAADIRGKSVLEVGAYNVNGSYRPQVSAFGPAKYIGTDMRAGPLVDIVCDATELCDRFGVSSFDVVISTEMLEHAQDWRLAVKNMKGVLKPGGLLILTTRSLGFPHHDYPGDFWRFETYDLQHIFSDFDIQVLAPDYSEPGAFIKARKHPYMPAADLARIFVHSMLTGDRSAA